MKKQMTIHTDGFEGFKKRSLERARKLDRGELLQAEKIITFDEQTVRALTGARLLLFKNLREKRRLSITALAESLNRPREAVSRDVKALASVGLVRVEEVSNPGHGRIAMVIPAAEKIWLEL